MSVVFNFIHSSCQKIFFTGCFVSCQNIFLTGCFVYLEIVPYWCKQMSTDNITFTNCSHFIQDGTPPGASQPTDRGESGKEVKVTKQRRRIVKMQSSDSDVSRGVEVKTEPKTKPIKSTARTAGALGSAIVRADRAQCPVCMRLFAKRYMRQHVKRHHSEFIKSPNQNPSPAKKKADQIVCKAKKQLFVRRSTRKRKK